MPKPKLHPFLVFEAINAAGKTTQFNLLIDRLQRLGFKVKSYHFHQRGFPTGQLIEHKFLHQTKARYAFSRREQAMLYIQDFFTRAAEINEYRRQLQAKTIVLTDRFYSSTLAYQSIGLSGRRRREMIKWIKWLCEEGQPALPKPDQVILLDTPVNIAAQHLTGTKKDYFENTRRLTLLRHSYLRLAKEEKWTVINSMSERGKQRSVEAIHDDIWSQVEQRLK